MSAAHAVVLAVGILLFLGCMVGYMAWAMDSLGEALAIMFGVLAVITIPSLLITWALS